METEMQVMMGRVDHAFDKIKWTIPEDVRRGRFLDIGCGTGNGVIAALKHGASLAVGIDRSFDEFRHEFTIHEFQGACLALGVEPARALMLEASIFSCRFAPSTFDYAMMLDSIEHVPDPKRFIDYAFDSLRPGGYFLLDTCPLYWSPVGHHLWNWFPAESEPWAHLRLGFEERVKSLAIDDWSLCRYRELNKVTHQEIRDWVIGAGFSINVEERGKPDDAKFAMYEKHMNTFDASIQLDEQWLFEDWLLIVARKESNGPELHGEPR